MSYKIILPEQISSDMVNRISEIDEFKGQWVVLKNLAPDRLSFLRKVATIASVGSSTRIEGALLTDVEIDELLSNINRQSFRSRDEEEVAGYAEAMNLVFDSYESIMVTENHLKQLHRTLLKFSSKDKRHFGEYKKLSNNVEAFDGAGKSLGIIFETATPFQTPFYMKDLIEWYEQELKDKIHHPLLIIGTFIVHFLAIHPFQDGNGRLSRILTTLLLLKHGYFYAPYCSLESIIEENKDRYYLSLRRAQGSFKTDHQGIEEWLKFFLRTLSRQKDILRKKITDEATLSLTNLPAVAVKILEIIGTHGKTDISEIVTLSGVNRNTIKKYLKQLTTERLIMQHGKTKGAWYSKA